MKKVNFYSLCLVYAGNKGLMIILNSEFWKSHCDTRMAILCHYPQVVVLQTLFNTPYLTINKKCIFKMVQIAETVLHRM